MTDFKEVEVNHIRREENTRADVLSKLASGKNKKGLSTVIQQSILGPTMSTKECLNTNFGPQGWLSVMKKGVQDRDACKEIADSALHCKASHFLLIRQDLYKRGFSTPLLKCLGKTEVEYVMNETHNGVCGTHSGGSNMESRVLKAGYYWPELRADCTEFSKKCKNCQEHRPRILLPVQNL